LRLDKEHGADGVEGLVLGGRPPALLRGAGLEADHFVHDVLPCPLRHHWIAAPEVNAGQAAFLAAISCLAAAWFLVLRLAQVLVVEGVLDALLRSLPVGVRLVLAVMLVLAVLAGCRPRFRKSAERHQPKTMEDGGEPEGNLEPRTSNSEQRTSDFGPRPTEFHAKEPRRRFDSRALLPK